MENKEMTSKEAFIKFTEYVVNIFNQRIDKNLRKDYFYNKYINFSINDFPLRKVLEDLERLEQIDNANPSEALNNMIILATELGTSKDVKFAENRFPKMLMTIQQALLKAQKHDKILEILKPYFKGAVFPSAINFNFSEEDWKAIEEWLGND